MKITRIIGAIILLTGIIGYFTKISGAIIIGILGLILLIAPAKHGQEMLELFRKSIKRWKTILLTALYDATFWLLALGTGYVYTVVISKKIAGMQTLTITPDMLLKPELIEQNALALESMLTYMVAGGVILLLALLIIYTISRALIWTKIANQKLTKRFFLKFLGLNAIWWAIWIALIILMAVVSKTNAKQAILGLFIFAFYFTPIVHTLFTKKQLIGHALGHGIAYGITKIHKLIVPYTLALIVYIIIYQPFRLLQNTRFMQAATILLVVLYLAWMRTYLYEVIKKL